MSIRWPKHFTLHLTHNPHKASYRTVQEEIDDEEHGYTMDRWVSAEQREKAISTNECWILQWYPETPVGFCLLSAADLDVLLAAALDQKQWKGALNSPL